MKTATKIFKNIFNNALQKKITDENLKVTPANKSGVFLEKNKFQLSVIKKLMNKYKTPKFRLTELRNR